MRKVDDAIHRILIFSAAAERHKQQLHQGLNLQEVKSVFNLKILNFIMGFTMQLRSVTEHDIVEKL